MVIFFAVEFHYSRGAVNEGVLGSPEHQLVFLPIEFGSKKTKWELNDKFSLS